MSSETANMSAKDKIYKYINAYGDAMPLENIDRGFVRHATLKSVTEESDTNNANIVWSLTIPPLCGNSPIAKTIHGGAIATFFDHCIRCFLANRRLTTTLTVDSTNAVEMISPVRQRSA